VLKWRVVVFAITEKRNAITDFCVPTSSLLMQLLIFSPLLMPLLMDFGTITASFRAITGGITPFPSVHY
jgi:hypothetical protein